MLHGSLSLLCSRAEVPQAAARALWTRADKQPAGAHVLTEYDPSPESVFDAVIPEYLYGVLYGAVVKLLLRAVGAPHGNGGCVG